MQIITAGNKYEYQKVYIEIDGALRTDVYCEGISISPPPGGAVADMRVAGKYAVHETASKVANIKPGSIVKIWIPASRGKKTIFIGSVSAIEKIVSPNDNAVSFTARDHWFALADRPAMYTHNMTLGLTVGDVFKGLDLEMVKVGEVFTATGERVSNYKALPVLPWPRDKAGNRMVLCSPTLFSLQYLPPETLPVGQALSDYIAALVAKCPGYFACFEYDGDDTYLTVKKEKTARRIYRIGGTAPDIQDMRGSADYSAVVNSIYANGGDWTRSELKTLRPAWSDVKTLVVSGNRWASRRPGYEDVGRDFFLDDEIIPENPNGYDSDGTDGGRETKPRIFLEYDALLGKEEYTGGFEIIPAGDSFVGNYIRLANSVEKDGVIPTVEMQCMVVVGKISATATDLTTFERTRYQYLRRDDLTKKEVEEYYDRDTADAYAELVQRKYTIDQTPILQAEINDSLGESKKPSNNINLSIIYADFALQYGDAIEVHDTLAGVVYDDLVARSIRYDLRSFKTQIQCSPYMADIAERMPVI